MGIDGIGKKGPPQAPGEISGAGAAGKKEGVEKTFQVDKAAPAEGRPVDASSPLARLRAGDLDVEGYIDATVDARVQSMKGLSPDELAFIKSTLRDQVASDPALVDLVRSATGQTPKLPED